VAGIAAGLLAHVSRVLAFFDRMSPEVRFVVFCGVFLLVLAAMLAFLQWAALRYRPAWLSAGPTHAEQAKEAEQLRAENQKLAEQARRLLSHIDQWRPAAAPPFPFDCPSSCAILALSTSCRCHSMIASCRRLGLSIGSVRRVYSSMVPSLWPAVVGRRAFDGRESNGEATPGGDSTSGGNRLARRQLQTDRRPDSGGGHAETITRSHGLARSRGD
jgi:hypothetical protein